MLPVATCAVGVAEGEGDGVGIVSEAGEELDGVVACSGIENRETILCASVAGVEVDRKVGGDHEVASVVTAGVGEKERGSPSGDCVTIGDFDVRPEAVGDTKGCVDD